MVIWCVLGTSVLKCFVTYVIGKCGIELPGSFLANNITPTIIVAAICLFKIFKNINIKRERLMKIIVSLAMFSYGVFLMNILAR